MSVAVPEMAFPLAEYETRVERTRVALRARGLDALLVGTGVNLTYLTGYPSPLASPSRPFLFLLPVDGEPCLIVQDGRHLEAGRLSWVPDVRAYARLSRLPVEVLVELLRERGLEAGRIGMEHGYEMTPGYAARELEAVIGVLPRVAFADGADALWAVRLVKSALELAYLRRACAITTGGLRPVPPRAPSGNDGG